MISFSNFGLLKSSLQEETAKSIDLNAQLEKQSAEIAALNAELASVKASLAESQSNHTYFSFFFHLYHSAF
jgi:hypothetical protein